MGILSYLRAKYNAGLSVVQGSFLGSKRGITTTGIIALAVGVMMLGILLPIGLSAWENYTPTGATLVIIWPIGAVLIVLGIVMGFFRDTNQ